MLLCPANAGHPVTTVQPYRGRTAGEAITGCPAFAEHDTVTEQACIRRNRLFSMSSLDDFVQAKLTALEGRHLRRTVVTSARRDGAIVARNGRQLISFSCNDYLGLSTHPALAEAARQATETYGVGAGASRLVTGNHPLYDELEARLARLKGTAAACVFGSGYLANTGIIPALVGADDLIIVDELAHACIHAGAKLSGAQVQLYRHCDTSHAEGILTQHRAGKKHALIATDGVFSMDGDI